MANEQFINQNTIAAMLNPQVANLGSLVGAPIAQGMARADDRNRKDAIMQQETELREDTAEAVAFLQMPEEQWNQALSNKYTQARDSGDTVEMEGVGQLMQMDSPSLRNMMTEAAVRGSHLLPAGVLSGAGIGGASDKNFALQGSQDQNLYKDARGELYKLRQIQNPNTGEYYTKYTSVTPDAGDPSGKVSLASKDFQTSKEDAAAARALESARQDAKNISDVGSAANKEEQKELGKLRGVIGADETKNFRASKSQDLQLGQLTNALRLADTGKFSQLKAFAGKYMPGVEVEDEQALQSIITSYVMGELSKQTGPKTDFDFIKAAETQVQMGNTKGANELILKRMKENQDYSRARWKAWQKFKKSGKNAEDFEDSFKYTSVFDKEADRLKELRSKAGL